MEPTQLKRRILHKLRIDEISGVDRPAQEGARVTILKRYVPEMEKGTSYVFEKTVADIRKRDNCTGAEAMSKARLEAPDAFAAYRGDAATVGEDFEALVEADIAKGCPPHVAAQRVLQQYGARPDAARIRKSAAARADFLAEVDTLVRATGCSRTAAMKEVRRREPELFLRFQEG